jgi:hypothetical protein
MPIHDVVASYRRPPARLKKPTNTFVNPFRLSLIATAATLLCACTTSAPSNSPAARTAVTGINLVEDPAGYPLRGRVRDLFVGRLQDELFRENGGFHRGGNLTLRWKTREWNETTDEPFGVGVTYVNAEGRAIAEHWCDGSQSHKRNEARARDRLAPSAIQGLGLTLGYSDNELARVVQHTADDLVAYTQTHFSQAAAQ